MMSAPLAIVSIVQAMNRFQAANSKSGPHASALIELALLENGRRKLVRFHDRQQVHS